MNFAYPKMYTLTSQVYLDKFNQCYKNIITINMIPEGPLRFFVRRIQAPPLSIFQRETSGCNTYQNCLLALTSLHTISSKCDALITPNEIPDLFSFLVSNGYRIDTSITKMMNNGDVKLTNKNIICFFSYLGNTDNQMYIK